MIEIINDLFAWKVVPSRNDKYVYTAAGAIVGGVAFGMSPHWATAICWDIIAVLVCWVTITIAPSIGEFIANPFHFLSR